MIQLLFPTVNLTANLLDYLLEKFLCLVFGGKSSFGLSGITFCVNRFQHAVRSLYCFICQKFPAAHNGFFQLKRMEIITSERLDSKQHIQDDNWYKCWIFFLLFCFVLSESAVIFLLTHLWNTIPVSEIILQNKYLSFKHETKTQNSTSFFTVLLFLKQTVSSLVILSSHHASFSFRSFYSQNI